MGHRPAEFVDYSGHKANGPLRGQKTEVYEGGHRVPLLARWPGKVEAGATSDQLVALTDMLATTAELLNRPLPDNAGEDSFSFLPALLGRAPAGEVRDTIVHDSNRGQFAIRQGPWKLLLCQGGGGIGWEPVGYDPLKPRGQLYNLERDPGEAINLYVSQRERVGKLTALLEQIQMSGRSRR